MRPMNDGAPADERGDRYGIRYGLFVSFVLVLAGIFISVSIEHGALRTKYDAVESDWKDLARRIEARNTLAQTYADSFAVRYAFALAQSQSFRECCRAFTRARTREAAVGAARALESRVTEIVPPDNGWPNPYDCPELEPLALDILSAQEGIWESRMRYNKSVQDYNGALMRLPFAWVAQPMGWHAAIDFSALPDEKPALGVD